MTSASQRLRRMAMNRHGKNRDPKLNRGKIGEFGVPDHVVAASLDGTHGSHLFSLDETYLVEFSRIRLTLDTQVHRSGVTFSVHAFSAKTWSLWRRGDLVGAAVSVLVMDNFKGTELGDSIAMLEALGSSVCVVARVVSFNFDRNPAAIMEVVRVYQPD